MVVELVRSVNLRPRAPRNYERSARLAMLDAVAGGTQGVTGKESAEAAKAATKTSNKAFAAAFFG